MNQRRLGFILGFCLVNLLCVLLISAEEDDTRVPLVTVTATIEPQDAIHVPSSDNDSHTSEINETYPKDEYRPHIENDQIERNDIDREHDETIETREGEEGQAVMQQVEQELGDFEASLADPAHESHEDHGVNGDASHMESDPTDDTVISSYEEQAIEDNEVDSHADHDIYSLEATDEVVTESSPPMEEEREESNIRTEEIQEAEDWSRDTRAAEENFENVESESPSNKDNSNDGPPSQPIPDQPENAETDITTNEHDIEEESKFHSETNDGSTDWDTYNESKLTQQPETIEETEPKPIHQEEHRSSTIDTDYKSDVIEETAVVGDEPIENVVASSESTEAESTPQIDGSKESDGDITHETPNASEGEAQIIDSEPPPMEEKQSPSEISELESPIREMAEDQQLPPKGPSYLGLWGTPIIGARPPDMELLYRVFESRIKEQLGIGPIPESELRENIFPLGIGYDDEVDEEDGEETRQDGDESAPAQAKLQDLKDANSDFVEGLDDIDKFFEGVDPPDELDVGASGSSMQDMLTKKGKEILIKRIRMGIKMIREGFDIARSKVFARFAELKERDIDVQAIVTTAWSKTLQAYEAVVAFLDTLLDFGNDDAEVAEDFEVFKRQTMEGYRRQDAR